MKRQRPNLFARCVHASVIAAAEDAKAAFAYAQALSIVGQTERPLASYLVVVEGGVALKALARAGGCRKRSTLRSWLHAIEDRRDTDPAFDQRVDTLASRLHGNTAHVTA